MPIGNPTPHNRLPGLSTPGGAGVLVGPMLSDRLRSGFVGKRPIDD
jgi:hypothetical protein